MLALARPELDVAGTSAGVLVIVVAVVVVRVLVKVAVVVVVATTRRGRKTSWHPSGAQMNA